MRSEDVVRAAAVFLPLVTALMREAETTGGTGTEKREAVANASEQLYRRLQQGNTVKELKDVPWEAVAPLVVPAVGGLISILAGMFNRLMGKVWSFIGRARSTQ